MDKTHDLWNIRFVNQIINAMADGVFSMDAKGRISLWNRSMERISGYTAQEALGKTCQLLQCSRCFGKECPSGISSCQILEKEYSGAKECHLRHRDGHDVPVIKNASVVKDENDRVIGVVETVTDMSALHQARQMAEMAALRLGEIHRLENIIGQSAVMREVFSAIKVFPIHVPPLRQRREDVPLLVSHFIANMNKKTGKQIQGMSQGAMRITMDYPWPGNVRELENAIEHAFVLCNRGQIGPMDLPIEIRQVGSAPACAPPADPIPRATITRKKLSRESLLELLEQCDWNKAEVARQVGLSRTAVWKYMKKWDIPLQPHGTQ